MTERNDRYQKMSDLMKFVDLLVKQISRRAVHEYKNGKYSNTDKHSIYCHDFLRRMHEKPRENIYRLVKNPYKTLKGERVDAHFDMTHKDNRFTKLEQMLLLDFVTKVKDKSPPRQLLWIDLQHFFHYAYRNFVSSDPSPSAEILTTFFLSEMGNLIDSLRKYDESQLWLRIFALLREYCIFAQWQFSKLDQEYVLIRFFCYYEAMLTAAKNLVPIFVNFENEIIYKNYKVCWVDFNTCMFIRFFYESEQVQRKLSEITEAQNSPGDRPEMFQLFSEIKKLWNKEIQKVNIVNQENRLTESSPGYGRDKQMMAAHKKVLTANFWVDRHKAKEQLYLTRLDHHIFDLMRDRKFSPEGPGLNQHGQCICEECMTAKYKDFVENGYGQDFSVIQSPERYLYCQRCKTLIRIVNYHRHVNSHAVSDLKEPKNFQAENLNRLISENMDFVKLGNNAASLPELLNEKLKISDTQLNHSNFSAKRTKDGILKNQLASIFNGKCDSNKNDIETTKLAFEEFLKQKKDNSPKNDHLLNKRSFIKIKKDIYENSNSNGNEKAKVCDGIFKASAITNVTYADSDDEEKEIILESCRIREEDLPRVPPMPPLPESATSTKSEKLAETESRMREIRRNGHKPYPTARNLHTKWGSTEENVAGTCQHGNIAEQADSIEQKKCDCTYCEVFGTVHKNELLRDRLRVRLHQRREKRSKENLIKTSNPAPTTNSVKIKNVISKVETRVPLPSSPTNIPSTPSISSDSSIATTEFTDDIHGLVNYIEGNTALNKMERAQKKAAKKARQRERREQERIQAEEEAKRKLEEAKRKEEERKKELERLAEEKKKEEAALKKKLKKSRQAARRAAEQGKELVVEETIPAMVTIKRVIDRDTPNVTITLKGYTPDQDKLLYTLVEEPKEIKVEEKPLVEENNVKGKKKKKQAAQKPVEEPPKVVKKEVKVTLAVDKAAPAPVTPQVSTGDSTKCDKKPRKDGVKEKTINIEEELTTFGNLKLPPGITITKVEGPVNNRNYIGSESRKNSPIVGKSGVIVVDTEKLIHKTSNGAAATPAPPKAKNRKNKNKKKNKKTENGAGTTSDGPNEKPKMVTLKNPIFQQINNTINNKQSVADNSDNCAPAAIFTSENGMVTIRSSRLQQSLGQGSPNQMPLPLGMPLIPNLLSNPILSNPNPYFAGAADQADADLPPEKKLVSPLNAQEILSGLPGIEITKIDKNSDNAEEEEDSCARDAQVSILPSRVDGELDFNKDDWLYDNVFKPRDVLEDDMDAEELELEAFKRFCQQSVPPKHKEKVAHLNVADIVLKKKTDI